MPMLLIGTRPRPVPVAWLAPARRPRAPAAGARLPAAAAAAPVPIAAPRNRLRLRFSIVFILPSEVDDGGKLTPAVSAQTSAEVRCQNAITSETPAVKPPSSAD